MQTLHMILLGMSLYLGYASARAWSGWVGMGGGVSAAANGDHVRGSHSLIQWSHQRFEKSPPKYK